MTTEVSDAFSAGPEPGSILLAIILIATGVVVARAAGAGLSSALGDPLGNHRTLILKRIVTYAIFAVFAMSALHQLGIELSVILGAAGIMTVAAGFAAQTAASNFISGVFLLGERPFEVGETIQISGTTGEVISIDLISIRLRTFDNLLVRIPNESVMNSSVVNYTRFPIRRHDLKVVVDPVVDLEIIERVLLESTAATFILAEPKPIVIFLGFNESGLEIQLSCWALREHFLEMRNQLHRDVAFSLQDAQIPLGYPNRVLRDFRSEAKTRVVDSIASLSSPGDPS